MIDFVEHILAFEVSIVGSTLARMGRAGVIHPIFPWETSFDPVADPVAHGVAETNPVK